MTIQSNFPAIKPSLNLDFANVEALDPRITFTRASTATYYGTQTAKAEENLLIQSQNFSTSWTPGNLTVTVDTTAAPDGTTTADTLTATASTGAHNLNQNFTFIASQRYVCSVFVKQGTYQYFQIAFGNQGGTHANFDVTTGAGVVGTSAGVVSTSIVDSGNGWYRCVVVFDTINTSGVRLNMAASASAAREQSWTAAGTETVFIWGAQLEQRSAVTAYTPTTTQPITNYIPVLQTAAAGVPRFDHNPTTFESLGLLIEEQRTNLVTYSEQFVDAAWTKVRVSITSNTIVSPDGTLDADKLVEDTSVTTTHLIQLQNTFSTFVNGTSYTVSIYLKAAERSVFEIGFGSDLPTFNGQFSVFTLSGSGSVVNTGAITSTITSVGNGWYRVTATATAQASGVGVIRGFISNGSTNTYTGNGYSGLFIWGAQLEAGAFSTSYIPTVASQVTRAADAASMTGTNFSSWYSAGIGTVYSESSVYANNVKTQCVWDLVGGVAATNLRMPQSTTARLRAVVGNTFTGAGTGATITNNAPIKAAVAWSGLNGRLQSGTTGENVIGVAALDATQFLIGGLTTAGANNLNGTIKKLAFYPQRLSDTNLEALTS